MLRVGFVEKSVQSCQDIHKERHKDMERAGILNRDIEMLYGVCACV